MIWKVNTSSKGKQEEFRRFLGNNCIFTQIDLAEPLSDPLTIIRYKASQFDDVIVDDTELVIDGHNFGTNIRWKLADLHNVIGSRAVFNCYLARKIQDIVHVYHEYIEGQIAAPRGSGFGFTPFFLPHGSLVTFGEDRPDKLNPRYLAVQKMLNNNSSYKLEPLYEWTGSFQEPL